MQDNALKKLEAMLSEAKDINLNEYSSPQEFITLACGGSVHGGGTLKCGI